MSKKEKVLLIVALFLTVIATSAITTIIISPSRATAYSSDPVQDLSERVSFIEEDMMFVHNRLSGLQDTCDDLKNRIHILSQR